ncbi:MAG: toxin-antitoxin system YwqK family antitoxin [Verrucomicrobiales bacterium]|nr:toxin-antitoxin system YwqK family antitoxin [Verrucomicrobiales bacterium]
MELNDSFWSRRRVWGTILFLGTALLLCFLAPQLLVRRAEPWPEVLRSELRLLEGRLTRLGSSNAFSGFVIERYPAGLMMSRSAVSNGLLNGISQGWYTNGQIQVIEHFQNGISHGLRTKWYEGGQKLSEVEVVQGKLSGRFQRWHETGGLAEEVELRDGLPEGVSRSYFASGSLKARAELRQGKVVGQEFWKDGEQPGQARLDSGAVTR